MKPLCIDLYAGLGGWTEGFLAEGYSVIGFDIEIRPYPAQLVIQDVLTIHGSQFKNAACIVASPPCQKYSYLAMPWSRSANPNNSKAAKALRREWETNGPDNRLFDACFRIQREASEAAGRYIPLIVENVRGAQPWVGRSAWNYGSFFLWGDVPALMPINLRQGGKGTKPYANRGWTQGCAITLGLENYNGQKVPGFRFDGSGRSFQTASVESTGQKVPVYSDPRRNGGKGSHLTRPAENIENLVDGTKIGGDWFSDPKSTCRKHGSRSQARKLASAQIAKIPLPLAQHIASVYKPRTTPDSLEQAALTTSETARSPYRGIS